MKVPIGLLLLLSAPACATAQTRAAAPDTCPAIAPRSTPFPYLTYHTMVLDGKVVYARRPQRAVGAHTVLTLDTLPSDNILDRIRIKQLRVLTGDSARTYEACPGVSVVVVESARRHWWWPW